MPPETPRIFPLGESAVTVEFGNVISIELNQQALALAAQVEANPFPGFIEALPAYASTTVFFDLYKVRRNFPGDSTAFAAVVREVEKALENLSGVPSAERDVIDIPGQFDEEHGPDLRFVAEHAGLPTNNIIEIFTSQVYRVFMLGFLPGFAYMGEVDERIAIERKASPRSKVPKGSIGIAGRQTGIYSLESPGGWQIIGSTDILLFDRDSETPTFLMPGDLVRFVSV